MKPPCGRKLGAVLLRHQKCELFLSACVYLGGMWRNALVGKKNSCGPHIKGKEGEVWSIECEDAVGVGYGVMAGSRQNIYNYGYISTSADK